MIVYYDKCETCRGSAIRGVRANARKLGVELDERYVYALEQWREEAEKVGARMPFLYSPILKKHLELEGAETEVIEAFLEQDLKYATI